MEKSILITGRQGIGKTTKAIEITSKFRNNEVVFISCCGKINHKDQFLFSECTEKTKLVVFDELYDINQVEAFFNVVSNPITVNKLMKAPFSISPQFVLVCQSDITEEQLVEMGSSLYKIFDVIECEHDR